MFYALATAVMMACIMFYSFYPRNDAIRTVDMPRAKVEVIEMLAHHSAAVEAATLVSKNPETGMNDMAYEKWSFDSGSIHRVPVDMYDAFLPGNFNVSADFGFVECHCLSNTDGRKEVPCGSHTKSNAPDAVAPDGSTDYLITYIPADDDDMERPLKERALGEAVFLSSYRQNSTQRNQVDHFRINCGVVDCDVDPSGADEDFDPQGPCVLNNTRHLTVRLPRIIGEHDKGALMCITRLGATYELDDEKHYQIVRPGDGSP